MPSIIKADVEIFGLKTLAIHVFTADSLPLEQRERSGVAGNNPEEWKHSVLFDENRYLFLPPTYIFGTVKNGGKYVKKGKSNILRDLAATIQVMDEQIYLENGTGKIQLPELPEVIDAFSRSPDKYPTCYIERISVVNPSTKGRNIRYRVACKPGWHMKFTLLWDATIVARTSMRQAVEQAGQLIGIADGRGSIGYGRFEVTQFVISE